MDAEWEFLLRYPRLMRRDALQRKHSLRDLFNAVRQVLKAGVQWQFLPNDFQLCTFVYNFPALAGVGVNEVSSHELGMMMTTP